MNNLANADDGRVASIGTESDQDRRNAQRFSRLRDGSTQDEALALFDSLPVVRAEQMMGAWAGSGFPTDHPLDGLLETYHWHGKRFEDADNVHPLVFKSPGGKHVSVNPVFTPTSLLANGTAPKWSWLGWLVRHSLWLVSTKSSKARLRSIEHRGVVTSAMQYDALPINDVFRRVDADTVLGLMDLKGMARPFFFVLEREA